MSRDERLDAPTRYAFGENWQRFIEDDLTDERERDAAQSLLDLVGPVEGKSVLDIGSGSGLFSLAAYRLGAASVVSFDIDENSVAATRLLRERAGSPDSWRVERASILNPPPLEPADVAYSWGVLHHTGAMWDALRNAAALVAPDGVLAIAIYNSGHSRLWTPERWRKIKQTYNRAPRSGKRAMEFLYAAYDSAHNRRLPGSRQLARGMAYWADVRDWLGGYPYETATADELVEFCARLGLTAEKVRAQPSYSFSTNEIVFRREA